MTQGLVVSYFSMDQTVPLSVLFGFFASNWVKDLFSFAVKNFVQTQGLVLGPFRNAKKQCVFQVLTEKPEKVRLLPWKTAVLCLYADRFQPMTVVFI